MAKRDLRDKRRENAINKERENARKNAKKRQGRRQVKRLSRK